jgi:hypothetical protein
VAKLTDLTAMVADEVRRKHDAALAKVEGRNDEAESPRLVFREMCAAISADFLRDGFRFLRSGPSAQRTTGAFVHNVGFLTSQNNIPGEHVALWVTSGVRCKRMKDWRSALGDGQSDGLAGGQIGNLEPVPGWREWELADRKTRQSVVAHVVEIIRAIGLPFFDQFRDPEATVAVLRERDIQGLDVIQSLQFTLAFEAPDVARTIARRFLRQRPDVLSTYQEFVECYQREGIPPGWNLGHAKDLARATVLYKLEPEL